MIIAFYPIIYKGKAIFHPLTRTNKIRPEEHKTKKTLAKKKIFYYTRGVR